MADPDFNPRKPVIWAEESGSVPETDFDAPADPQRRFGYQPNTIADSGEFNFLLNAIGENLSSHDRMVGFYEDVESFLDQTDPTDYGYIYDPEDFNWSSPGQSGQTVQPYSGPSTEPIRTGSNGEYTVVAYGPDVYLLNSSFEVVTGGWEGFQVPGGWNIESVSVGANWVGLTYYDTSENETNAIFLDPDERFPNTTAFEVTLSSNPSVFQPCVEVARDRAILWNEDGPTLYEVDLTASSPSANVVSTVSSNGATEQVASRDAAFTGEEVVFSVDGGRQLTKYSFADDSWETVMDGGNATNGAIDSDGISVFHNSDFGSPTLRRHYWSVDNTVQSEITSYSTSSPTSISALGSTIASVSGGELELIDQRTGAPLPIRSSNYTIDPGNIEQVEVTADSVIVFHNSNANYFITRLKTTHNPTHAYHVGDNEWSAAGHKAIAVPQ